MPNLWSTWKMQPRIDPVRWTTSFSTQQAENQESKFSRYRWFKIDKYFGKGTRKMLAANSFDVVTTQWENRRKSSL